MIDKTVLKQIDHFLKNAEKETKDTEVIFSFALRDQKQMGIIMSSSKKFTVFTILKLIKVEQGIKEESCKDCGKLH